MLTKEDLSAIESIVTASVDSGLNPVKADITAMKTDIAEMKADIKLLATINQLDEIKKDKRLMRVFSA